MVGDEEQAARHLYRSIDCFSLTNRMQAKYAIQIAASLAYLLAIEQIRGISEGSCHPLRGFCVSGGDQTVDSVRVVFDIDLGIALLLEGDLIQARAVLTELRRFCPVFASLEARITRILPILNCLSARGVMRRLRLIWLEKKDDETIC